MRVTPKRTTIIRDIRLAGNQSRHVPTIASRLGISEQRIMQVWREHAAQRKRESDAARWQRRKLRRTA